jgi:hypothetical protein
MLFILKGEEKMENKCQAIKGNGEQCTHNSKAEFGNKYCGVHRTTWEMEQVRNTMKEQIGFHCGIDIGFINLSFSFLHSNGKVISYVGSVDEMIRFEEGIEPSVVELECSKTTLKHERLFLLLDSIIEFNQCINFIVERQPSLASAEGCRLDGLIMGYLRGKKLNGSYLDSRTRQSFTEASCPETSTDVKKKQFSISFVAQKFPSFFSYVQSKRKKVDDICDSLIYAYMSSEALTSSKVISKLVK